MSAHQYAPGRGGRCQRCGCTAARGPHTSASQSHGRPRWLQVAETGSALAVPDAETAMIEAAERKAERRRQQRQVLTDGVVCELLELAARMQDVLRHLEAIERERKAAL